MQGHKWPYIRTNRRAGAEEDECIHRPELECAYSTAHAADGGDGVDDGDGFEGLRSSEPDGECADADECED